MLSDSEGSRWREDKVLTISSYLPGVHDEEKAPQPLVSTYLATMHDSEDFGTLARLEAERCGIRQAKQVVVLGNGAAWIDTLHQQHFYRHVRILDWYHAKERLHAVARAAEPDDQAKQQDLAERLTAALWQGQAQSVAQAIATLSDRAGPPREADPQDHPRRVLQRSAGYFHHHADHMNYPAYRKRGWPIGIGMTEAGVKPFNKRVNGTEQFRNDHGIEPILAPTFVTTPQRRPLEPRLVVPLNAPKSRVRCHAPPATRTSYRRDSVSGRSVMSAITLSSLVPSTVAMIRSPPPWVMRTTS